MGLATCLRKFRLTSALIVWIALTFAVQAKGVRFPDRPGDRDFIADEADLLNDAQEKSLRKQLDQLLTDKAIPIIVVTIKSKADYGAKGMSIEEYATKLYNHWGIGHDKIIVKGRGVGRKKTLDWNKGVLLLVSVKDRKLRIEVGAGWGHTKDAACAKIIKENIVPSFKKKKFAHGIKAGVDALEQMAREEEITPPPRPWWHYALVIGGIVLTIASFVSMCRSGRSGWGWALWAVIFGILWTIIIMMLSSRGGSSGFSGGSFGGGSSGGGGASGSW